MENQKDDLWLRANTAHYKHASNATRALMASEDNNKLVNKHLLQIAEREQALSEFAGHVANSPALSIGDDE